jgi:hypothetical protein
LLIDLSNILDRIVPKLNRYEISVADFAAIVIFISETKQKSLEEVAAAFGDKTALPDETNLAREQSIFKDKKDNQHEEFVMPSTSTV